MASRHRMARDMSASMIVSMTVGNGKKKVRILEVQGRRLPGEGKAPPS